MDRNTYKLRTHLLEETAGEFADKNTKVTVVAIILLCDLLMDINETLDGIINALGDPST